MSVTIEGPYETPWWYLVIDGYLVPHVKVEKRQGDEDGANWCVVVDSRFATEWVTREEIQRWAFVLANMGAVCNGYTHHGKESSPLNRWKCGYDQLGSDVVAQSRRETMHVVDGSQPHDSTGDE